MTTSSKVTVSSPKEKRKVCSEALTVYQMPETLGVSKTLKVPRDRHCLQDTGALQTTHELFVIEFLIRPNRPTSNLPSDEIEKDGNRLSKSLPNLENKNLSRVWDLSETDETYLPREYPDMSGWKGLSLGHLREE